MDDMEILTKARGVYIALAFFVGTSCCFGQETKTVQGVKGEWVISNDITPIQAREKAIAQAKAEALRLAGVPEYVAESNLSYKTEQNYALGDIHESLTSIDVSGEISAFQVAREEKSKNEFGNLIYEVWINATVVLYKSSRDPGFTLNVNGIRENYQSPEELVFDILPSREGYLNIFILSDHETAHLFPNKMEKPEKFEGGRTYKFPRSRALDYEVSSKTGMEVNYVLLVYTKTEIPFLATETSENVLQFIAGIDPSHKCVKVFSILIRKPGESRN
jgi:hypothetical protein